MIKKQTGNLILLLTALIWGSSFVAQTTGMEHVQPFTFMGIRTVLGGLVLIPVILFQRRMQPKAQRRVPEVQRQIDRMSLIGGICCGLVLCIAGDLQQFGMTTTSPGKAGFITSLYIVIVPLLGIFIGKKIPKIVWFCVAAALFGFYLLCVTEQFTISTGDLLVLCCAFFFSIHIMVIDHFSEKGIDGVLMSCVQFLVAGGISLILMFALESPTWAHIFAARSSILYSGVMSCGVAYTLQILGQKRTDPTSATLLMSLESVFAALSGWLILHQSFSLREFLGCVLVFAAVLLSQIPLPQKNICTQVTSME